MTDFVFQTMAQRYSNFAYRVQRRGAKTTAESEALGERPAAPNSLSSRRAQRDTVLQFMRQARSRALTRFGRLTRPKPRQGHLLMPGALFVDLDRKFSGAVFRQHYRMALADLERMAGSPVNEHAIAHAQLLLFLFDEASSQMTDIQLEIGAIELMRLNARIRTLIDLMVVAKMIDRDSAERIDVCLSSALEMRMAYLLKAYGPRALQVEFVLSDQLIEQYDDNHMHMH